MSQPSAQFHLKPLFTVWFVSQDFHLVGSWREISLENWLSFSANVSKDALSIMPSQEFIRNAVFVTWLPADGVEDAPVDLPRIRNKRDDLVPILC